MNVFGNANKLTTSLYR